MRKFQQYLSGRHQLTTDHKPFLAIFSPEKSLPVMTLQRLQRWALIMMGYDYHIVYRKSANHANADALSRLPMASDPNFNKQESIVEIYSEVNMLHSQVILNLPLSSENRRLLHQKGADSGKGATFRYKWVVRIRTKFVLT